MHRQKTREKLISALYSQTPVGTLGNIVLLLVNLFTYFEQLPLGLLIFYTVGVLAAQLTRLGAYLTFKRYRFTLFNDQQYTWLYSATLAVNGLVWGIWEWLALVQLGTADALILVCVQAGICASAVSTLAASRLAVIAFTVPTLSPVFVQGFFIDSNYGLPLSIISLAFCMSIIFASRGIYQNLYQSIETSFINEQLAKKLYEFSNTDQLTGIANRRHFDNEFARLWAISNRNQLSISVVILDIDWFKKFNDSQGHLAGDECIKAVASATNNFFGRKEDLVARFGGEEFAVILPGINADRAIILAQGLCEHVWEENLQRNDLDDMDRITISAGVATCIPQKGDTPTALLDLADKALYQAKDLGKNQAVISPQLPKIDAYNRTDEPDTKTP